MENTNKRVYGYDFARAFAVFGMVIVNFKIVMNAYEGSQPLIWAASLLEGRAAAIFVILAGVGLSLMSAKGRSGNLPDLILKNRISLLKRSFLLIVVGLSYSWIWPADILHFYGFYIIIGAFLLSVKDRTLIIYSAVFIAGFVLLLFFFDYETGWDWNTLLYVDFWTVPGMIRHIFFNGFHPVFPWTCFLLFGMWLGRRNMSDTAFRRKIMLVSFIIWGITELLSQQLFNYFVQTMEPDVAVSLFKTSPMPPMPQYILSAGSIAVFIISVCIAVTAKFSNTRWVDILCNTGRLSLTLYVAHVVIGMGFLEAVNRIENQSIEFALFSSLVFNVLGVIFAHFWILKFKTGPLEKLFRKVN